MHLVFYFTDKNTDRMLINAIRHAGFTVQLVAADNVEIIPEADVYCFVGVKRSRLAQTLNDNGKTWLYFDKAYNRKWPEWWRVTKGAQQPTQYLFHKTRPADRAEKQGWLRRLRPWRSSGAHVVFAGSSAKYHGFVGHTEHDPTAYATEVIGELKKYTSRRIVYRPKPSWKAAVPIPGADFSVRHVTGDIHQALAGAHALVTHGSSTCFDALLSGVPSIVLGDGVLAPISTTTVKDIEHPYLASEDDRRRLLYNLAYCQWSLDEIAKGKANKYLESLVANGI